MYLFHVFLTNPAATALSSCIYLSSKLICRRREGTLTCYSKVVEYLLERYATDAVIAYKDVNILRFTQLSNIVSP